MNASSMQSKAVVTDGCIRINSIKPTQIVSTYPAVVMQSVVLRLGFAIPSKFFSFLLAQPVTESTPLWACLFK